MATNNRPHQKCRGVDETYPRSDIVRAPVPGDRVSWEQPYADYQPPTYTDEYVIGKPWADPKFELVHAFLYSQLAMRFDIAKS